MGKQTALGCTSKKDIQSCQIKLATKKNEFISFIHVTPKTQTIKITPNVPIKNAVLGAGPSTKALRGSFTLRSGVEGEEGDGSRGAPLAASRGRARRRVQALATLFGPRPLLPEQVSPPGRGGPPQVVRPPLLGLRTPQGIGGGRRPVAPSRGLGAGGVAGTGWRQRPWPALNRCASGRISLT